MSVYDAAKDALKLAQKADNAELVQKILDVQAQALDMQDKQFELQKKIEAQQREINKLNEKKKYTYEDNHTWLIDPQNPNIKLCPVCLNRDNFENPTVPSGGRQWCKTCSKEFK